MAERFPYRFMKTALAALAAGVALVSAAQAMPERVVSLDFCADQYVLAFADRAQIAAVSSDALTPDSFFRARALGLPEIHGTPEEVLARHAGLVVRTWRGSKATDALVGRLGTKTFQPGYAMTLADNFTLFEKAAAALGHPARGRAMAADYRARLAALKAKPKSRLKAVYMTPSGFTAGTGTYVDKVIHLAGFDTVARAADLKGWGPLPLEKMVISPPDLIIGSFFDRPDVHISAWSGGRHSVYKRLLACLPVIMVPSRELSCGGAFFVDAAETIRKKGEALGLFGSTEATP